MPILEQEKLNMAMRGVPCDVFQNICRILKCEPEEIMFYNEIETQHFDSLDEIKKRISSLERQVVELQYEVKLRQ